MDEASRLAAALRSSSEVVFKEGGEYDVETDGPTGIDETREIDIKKLRESEDVIRYAQKSKGKSRASQGVDFEEQQF